MQYRERFRFPDQDGFRKWLYTMAARNIADRVEYWRAQKRDGEGEAMRAGLYFVRIESGGRSSQAKVVLTR